MKKESWVKNQRPYDSVKTEKVYLWHTQRITPSEVHCATNFLGYLQSVANYAESTKAKNPWQAIQKYRLRQSLNAYLRRFYLWAELPDVDALKAIAEAYAQKEVNGLISALRLLGEQIGNAIQEILKERNHETSF